MKTNQHKDYVAKLFHVAIIFFATTIGIGLYALIGAPIRMPDMSLTFDKFSKISNNASVMAANYIGLSKVNNVSDNEIIIKLSNPSSDFQILKTTLIDNNLKEGTSYLVKLILNEKELKIPELLNYLSDIKPSYNLLRVMGDSRYYVLGGDKYSGIIAVSLLDSEIAFASITEWESKFIETTLPLIHPLFNKSDVSMYLKLGAVSRRINGVDSRVIWKGEGEIAYIWGIYKNNLIIAGSRENFEKIVTALE